MKKSVDSSVVLKAGIWYTISNFLFKGMAFITTPIFVRLLSKSEYGDFSNFISWMSILLIITSCDLHTSIIRSKLEFKDDIDSYSFSILGLSTVITALFYVIFLVFGDFIFDEILLIEKSYIHIMFLYLFAVPAYNVFITKQRAFYKYKLFSIMTGASVLLSLVCSLILVYSMENKLAGRIIGQYMPLTVLGFALYVLLAVRGKKIKLEYWKYALIICIPLVPHLLSMNILSSSSRIIIKRISGAEYAAVYSIAISCAHILGILLDSMNKAWAPWFLDTLHAKNTSDVNKVVKPYYLIFVVITMMVLLVAPEVVLILGGKAYYEAVYALPPLLVGVIAQFIYTMFVQVEFFEKKTASVAVGTMIAAVINVVLNIGLIEEFGYIVASYTTLIGYIFLMLFHYFTISKLGYRKIFDVKYLFSVFALSVAAIFACNWLYVHTAIRYCVIVMLMVGAAFVIYKKREMIKMIVQKKLKK